MKTEVEAKKIPKTPERFESYDTSVFKPQDRVVFRADGKWQLGKLNREPRVAKDKKSVFLSIQKGMVAEEGKETVTETKIAPRKVLFKEYEWVRFDGKQFEVKEIKTGPEGEIWYDLESEGTLVRRVNQDAILAEQKSKELTKEIDETVAADVRAIEIRKKLEELKDKVKYRQMNLLSSLEKKMAELRIRAEQKGVTLQVLAGLREQLTSLKQFAAELYDSLDREIKSSEKGKDKKDKKGPSFKFDEHKEELKKAVEELRKKPNDLKTDSKKKFKEKIDALVKLLKDLKEEDLEVEEKIIEMWQKCHNLDLEYTKEEIKRQLEIKPQKVEVKPVVIPSDLMTELLKQHPSEARVLLKKTYKTVLTKNNPEEAKKEIQVIIKEFFESLEGSLNSDLFKNKQVYWEDIRETVYKDEVMQRMASMLHFNVEEQVKYMGAQKLFHLRGQTDLPTNFGELKLRIDEWWNTSVLRRMPAALATRIAANTIILGGVGWAARKVFSFLPGPLKSAAVGATVGLAAYGINQGIDSVEWIKKQKEKASKEAKQIKKSMAVDIEMDKSFEIGDTLEFRDEKAREWGNVLSMALRRATEKDLKPEVISDGEKRVVLEGDEVILQQNMLKRAEIDAGEEPEKVKFKFAKAINGLRHNKKVAEKEKMLSDKKGWIYEKMKWLYDSVTQRRETRILKTRKGPKEFDDPVANLDSRVFIPMAIGATVGYAVGDTGNDLLRGALGATYGFQLGYRGQAEEENGEADMEAEVHVNSILKSIEEVFSEDPARVKTEKILEIKNYYNLLHVLLGGKSARLDMRYIDAETRFYFQRNQGDVAAALGRKVLLRRHVENVLFEIDNSGLFERISFASGLETMQQAGERQETLIENSSQVKWGREAKRWIRGTLYGAVGAVVGMTLGAAIDTVNEWNKGTGNGATHDEVSGGRLATETVLEDAPVVPKVDEKAFIADVTNSNFLRANVSLEQLQKYAHEWAFVYPDNLGDNFYRDEFRDWVLVDKALNPAAPVPTLFNYDHVTPAPNPEHTAVNPSDATSGISEQMIGDHSRIVLKPSSFLSDSFTVDYFDGSSSDKPFSFKLLAKYEPSVDPDGKHLIISKGGERITGLLETGLVDGEKVPVFKVTYSDGIEHSFLFNDSGKIDRLLTSDGHALSLKEL